MPKFHILGRWEDRKIYFLTETLNKFGSKVLTFSQNRRDTRKNEKEKMVTFNTPAEIFEINPHPIPTHRKEVHWLNPFVHLREIRTIYYSSQHFMRIWKWSESWLKLVGLRMTMTCRFGPSAKRRKWFWPTCQLRQLAQCRTDNLDLRPMFWTACDETTQKGH